MIYKSRDYGDGLGSHIQQYIFSITFAEIHGNTVYLSYNTKFEHNYTEDAMYKTNLLNYINLHKYYGMPDAIDESTLPAIDHHYRFCESNLDKVLESETFKQLKERFFLNKVNPYDKSFFNVAVHVRRPNPHDNRNEGTNTPDSYYIDVMNRIRREYKDTKPIKFHIYSQGKLEMFDIYKADDVLLHIDTPIIDTYDGLIFGDVLVTSASSLSYTAAMLSNGKVFFKRFWHPPYKNWIVI